MSRSKVATQQEIADALVADGWARELLPGEGRCVRTLELEAVPRSRGRIFVTTAGKISRGYSKRTDTLAPVLQERYGACR